MAVFIIPGFFRKKDYYNDLVNHLTEHGLEVSIMDLGGSRNFKNLHDTADMVLKILSKTPEKDDIIAHSFGGLVIKKVIANSPEILKKIRSLSFVAVPHHGSWSALLMPIFGATRDLLPIKKHFKQLLSVPLPDNTTNFIAATDIKIWHKTRARLKDYIDVLVPNTNHDNIIKSQELADKIVGFLKTYNK